MCASARFTGICGPGGPAASRSPGEPALIKVGLLLRRGGAPEHGVAVRKAAETGDDVVVEYGPLQGLGVAGLVGQALAEGDAGLLVGEVLGVLPGQVEEWPEDGVDRAVEALGHGRA